MARYTSALSFVLVLVLFSIVKIEARESKFITKAVVLHANNTTKNVTHHVDLPSPSPSPSPLASPSPAPVEAEIDSGYGRDEIPSTSGITSDSLFENKIPTEEYDEKFGKDEFDNNDLPSNYKEFGNNRLPNNNNERFYATVPQGDNNKEKFDNNGLPSNYNEHSYVTVPQGDNKDKFDNEEFSNNGLPSNYNEDGLPSNYDEDSYVTVPQGTNLYDTKFTPTATNNENEFLNDEEKPTPEEEKLFSENRDNNELNDNLNEPQKFSETPKFAEMDNYFNDNDNDKTYNSETYNVKKPQGMSDTRSLENVKYNYALNRDGRQSGYVKGGSGSPQKYNSEVYNGKTGEPKSSKYEFDTMEEVERQEGGYSQIPGDYIDP